MCVNVCIFYNVCLFSKSNDEMYKNVSNVAPFYTSYNAISTS